MTSANTPVPPSPGPSPSAPRATLRASGRSALCAFAVAGCCAAVGCQGVGERMAALNPLKRSPAATSLSDDPFNAAEVALAEPAGGTLDGGEGRARLGDPVRTASVDVTRTVARPAGVTRVDPSVPPGRGNWKAGEGADTADVGKVTLAGGAFAATDAPAAGRVTPAVATSPVTAEAAPKPAARPEPKPEPKAASTPKPKAAKIDWAAEMDAFAEEAARDAAESATPADASPTPSKESATPAQESVTPSKSAPASAGETIETVDPDALPSAPLWGAATAEAADATEAADTADAAPAPKFEAPNVDPTAAPRPTSAQPPGGGWHSRKTGEIDPFAGL